MGALGQEVERFLVRGSAAVRTDVRCTLPSWCLPEFLVLDFCIRASVRYHRAPTPRLGISHEQLLLHFALHTMALGVRRGGCFHSVLGFRRSSSCLACPRAAGVFLCRGVPRPLFPPALFCPDPARGFYFDRGCRYFCHPLAHREVHFALASRPSSGSVCRRMAAGDSP